MDLSSVLCLMVLPTLATLHPSGAEDPPIVDGSKTSLTSSGVHSLPSVSDGSEKRWSNFHSWGKRWGNFGSWGKRFPLSEEPEKKWSDSAFTSWGKRDSSPNEQKRNWNQFVTWGKRNWHTMSSWGKRAHGQQDKKWNSLSTWGKRSGWNTGFTSWGKRNGVDVTDSIMKYFDANDDGVLDSKEVRGFLTWMGSLSSDIPPHA